MVADEVKCIGSPFFHQPEKLYFLNHLGHSKVRVQHLCD